MTRTILLFPLLWGCKSYEPTFTDSGQVICTTTEQNLADVADWAGPSEAEAMTSARASAPTVAVWDEETLGAEYATLVVALDRTADAATITEHNPEPGHTYDDQYCRTGRELRLPVQLTLSFEGGGAVGTLSGAIAATEAEEFTIYLDYGFTAPAELTGEWATAAYAEMAERYEDDDPTFEMGLLGTWDDAQVDIWAEGETPDVGYGSTLWRGYGQKAEF